MDTLTNNNVNYNGNKPSLHKSRSNTSFGQAAVAKSDVGDFQEGYFVMADMPPLPQHRSKTHKTPERNQRKNEHPNNYRHQQRSTNLDQHIQRESDSNVSNARTTTSPNRSPTRNKRINSHSPQRHQTTTSYMELPTTLPLSPHKPRKAYSQTNLHEKRVDSPLSLSPESGSPPKGSSRWAGPAFSNAPPPSSLPIPDFPPFDPSQQAVNPTPSSPILAPTFPQHVMYQEPSQYIVQPPVYSPVAHYGYPLHLVYDIPAQPSLAQLSTDLRRMLNISQPMMIPA